MKATPNILNTYTLPVLLIDDDELILDSLSELLEADGYQVHTANSSAECIAKISNGIFPDIIITDYRMRNRNGVEVVKSIRNFLDEEIPAIIFTDDTSNKVREAARQNKCIFLSKPQETNILANQISAMSA